MGATVFKAFRTSLAIEMVVSGFRGPRDCASGEGKGGRELNKNNDVVICSFWKSSHLRHSQNQVVTPKMVSQEASELYERLHVMVVTRPIVNSGWNIHALLTHGFSKLGYFCLFIY